MLGLPLWVWVLIGLIVVVAAAVRSYYIRFRGMCRRTREELAELLKREHPGVEVVEERQGDLVLRMADGSERVWEMADVYAGIARLPGMGVDPGAREEIYRQEVDILLRPLPDADAPLALATHGHWIRPQLLRPETLAGLPSAADVLQRPVPGLGLVVVYAVAMPWWDRYLTVHDLEALGLDAGALHERALANLREAFPAQMVATATAGESGAAVQLHDGFDAARLLLVPEHLPPDAELVALAPHQEMLVLLPPSVLDHPEKLREGLAQLEQDDHTPLLDRPVRVTREGFAMA